MDLKLKLDRLSAALKDSREREAQAVIALEKVKEEGGIEKEEVAREVEAGQWRIKQMDLQVTIKKLREELKTRTEEHAAEVAQLKAQVQQNSLEGGGGGKQEMEESRVAGGLGSDLASPTGSDVSTASAGASDPAAAAAAAAASALPPTPLLRVPRQEHPEHGH
ncbi:hypothetical protein CLOM_g785 [Closterium sp. NIES-68]|nr:hypothetical protein CLOM_g785 [Closterium sp. NIES-68]